MPAIYESALFWIFVSLLLANFAWRLFRKVKDLQSKIRSQSVIHGQSFEQLVPFMKEYPYNPRNAKFLGKPIDLIQFNDNDIVFIEVKTGKSNLSEREKKIKRLIENKAVRYEVVRS